MSQKQDPLLVIENDQNFAKVLLDMAHDKGYKGVVELDGEAGLKAAREIRPDAITLDIDMPGMDGLEVLDRLKRQGMIDDARYAKQFTRQRAEIRKQGKFRIARELRARGIPDRHIDVALEESAKETDERAVVRQRIERKLKSLRGEIDDRKIASLFRSLLRAGFPPDMVRNELRAVTREDLPTIDAVDEECA